MFPWTPIGIDPPPSTQPSAGAMRRWNVPLPDGTYERVSTCAAADRCGVDDRAKDMRYALVPGQAWAVDPAAVGPADDWR
jgi:hypothetical protein